MSNRSAALVGLRLTPVRFPPPALPGSATAFDPTFYGRQYAHELSSPEDLLAHYERQGEVTGAFRSFAELVAHEAVVRASGVWNEDHYRRNTIVPTGINPVIHYLLHWPEAGEPGPAFEGKFFAPYYGEIPLRAAPAVIYGTLKDAGWPVYLSRKEAEAAASGVLASGVFDPHFYRSELQRNCDDLEAALHYLIVGERTNRDPSADFSVAHYARQSAATNIRGANLLLHYIQVGRSRGYTAKLAPRPRKLAGAVAGPRRATVLLTTPNSSSIGASLLAQNLVDAMIEEANVLVLPMSGDGNGSARFPSAAEVIGPLGAGEQDEASIGALLDQIQDSYQPDYVIACGADASPLFTALSERFMPSVTVVTKAPTTEVGNVLQGLDRSTILLFPAEIVRRSAGDARRWLSSRRTHVLPQAAVRHPTPAGRDDREFRRVKRRLVVGEGGTPIVVIGCGPVEFGKGVELFVSCAAALKRRLGARPVRFLWLVRDKDPKADPIYAALLQEQRARSGVADVVHVLDGVQDVGAACEAADVLFLSARIEELSEPAVEIAARGVPVVCFEGASGLADLLAADPEMSIGVVPYAETEAAAAAIERIVSDAEQRRRLGQRTSAAVRTAFNPARYASALGELGRLAGNRTRQRRADWETIRSDPDFEADLFLRQRRRGLTRDEAILDYLIEYDAAPAGNLRRPFAGFHPQMFAEARGGAGEGQANPLAEYIRQGKPAGDWNHPVLELSGFGVPPAKLRVALHGHFYYPELVPGLLRRLKANRTRVDLYLNTDTPEKAQEIGAMVKRYARDRTTVRVLPNSGRDIRPFLEGFPELRRGYDVVGHVHGKRSLSVNNQAFGRTWRDFNWQHLIGDFHPAVDHIVGRMAEDPSIGLIFPEDPSLVGWDANRGASETLAGRMRLRSPLPRFLEFPVGMMFWARPEALAPLFDLKLADHEYPEEPAPDDGTVLHAIERLLTFVVRERGFRFETVRVPRLHR